MDISLGTFDNLSFIVQLNLCLRIVAAALCGCIIGYERSRRLKGAGVRTHMVVAMSAALMTIVSKYGFFDVLGIGPSVDASRIAANIVTGIPFLGAGVILVRQSNVQGLTTAAGMWATCGIGMALGAGLYLIGVFAAILLMILQLLLHKILTGYDASFVGEITIVADNTFNADGVVREELASYSVTIQNSKVKKLESGKLEYMISFKTKCDIPSNVLATLISKYPEFVAIEI